MNEYVAECRREWRRLGVSSPIADEMAAELEADLDEAPSLDEVLGTDATDARAFARRWALERGVVPTPRRGLRAGVAAALAAFALAAIAGALLMVVSSPSHSQRFEPVPAVAIKPAPPPLVRWVPSDDSGDGADTVGLVLLSVGLVGFLPLALLASRRVALRQA